MSSMYAKSRAGPQVGRWSEFFPNAGPIDCTIEYYPIGSMYAIYMVTFTINIPPMLPYIAYMDPMGIET